MKYHRYAFLFWLIIGYDRLGLARMYEMMLETCKEEIATSLKIIPAITDKYYDLKSIKQVNRNKIA